MIWLPEPEIEDISVIREESWVQWLRRSTSPEAKESRAFLNKHVSDLPQEWQQQLKHDLEHRWQSAFFELVCATLLQKLGASLQVESEMTTSNGVVSSSKPDFTVTFSGSTIIVEAKSTMLDPAGRRTLTDQSDLTRIINDLIPSEWNYLVWALPSIGQSDSKREFKTAVTQLFYNLPSVKNISTLHCVAEISLGKIHLEIFPKEIENSWVAGPMNNAVDDLKEKISNAIRAKRRQVRDANLPVILAINLDGMGGKPKKINEILFGDTWRHINYDTYGFKANGLFTGRANVDKPPTFAGVLAFFNVGLWGWEHPPILYVHPRFEGTLPKELLCLEQRHFDPQKNEIVIIPSTSSLKEAMEFVSSHLVVS